MNYYIKHLLIIAEGKFAPTMQRLAHSQDAQVLYHPVTVLLSDLMWGRVACRSFRRNTAWFLFTLVVFIVGHSVLQLHVTFNNKAQRGNQRYVVFGCRMVIFVMSMPGFIYQHFSP